MKLSEAIRLGSILGPQLKRLLWNDDPRDFSSCAVGAALIAVGLRAPGSVLFARTYDAAIAVLPMLAEKVNNPVTPVRNTLWNTIATLNNDHGWTREQIADWVETLERQHDAASLQPGRELASSTEPVLVTA